MNISICEFLKNLEIEYLIGVPASELSLFFSNLSFLNTIIVPREDDAIALASSLNLCDRRTLVLIQSSGIGNCLNVFASLVVPYEIPINILISTRGGYDEENEVQILLGESAYKIFNLFAVNVIIIKEIQEINKLASLKTCNTKINVILIHHRVFKKWQLM